MTRGSFTLSELSESRLRALLASEHVSGATRAALEPRLSPAVKPPEPPIFSDAERTVLRAVVDRLFPELDDLPHPDLATAFEGKLAAPRGKGWRYATLPDDLTTHRLLLRLFDETAMDARGEPFAALAPDDQDAVLSRVQTGERDTAANIRLDVGRAFEELLAGLAECYACDPRVQVAFGYVGFADLPAWERIGLDERDAREIATPPAATDG